MPAALPCVRATCYVTALREGGSLPGLVEASDDGMYVTKFRGSGQGENALVAEVVAGELARRLGLLVPDLAIVEIPVEMGRAEPDPDIQELLDASVGPNLGMDFLPGSLPFTLPLEGAVDPASPPTSSGSTPSSRTSTGRIATRTSWSGTDGRG